MLNLRLLVKAFLFVAVVFRVTPLAASQSLPVNENFCASNDLVKVSFERPGQEPFFLCLPKKNVRTAVGHERTMLNEGFMHHVHRFFVDVDLFTKGLPTKIQIRSVRNSYQQEVKSIWDASIHPKPFRKMGHRSISGLREIERPERIARFHSVFYVEDDQYGAVIAICSTSSKRQSSHHNFCELSIEYRPQLVVVISIPEIELEQWRVVAKEVSKLISEWGA